VAYQRITAAEAASHEGQSKAQVTLQSCSTSSFVLRLPLPRDPRLVILSSTLSHMPLPVLLFTDQFRAEACGCLTFPLIQCTLLLPLLLLFCLMHSSFDVACWQRHAIHLTLCVSQSPLLPVHWLAFGKHHYLQQSVCVSMRVCLCARVHVCMCLCVHVTLWSVNT